MSLSARRFLLVGTTAAVAATLAALSIVLFRTGERTVLDVVLLGLFLLVMTWEALVVSQVGLGFLTFLRGRDGRTALELRAIEVEPVATGRSRTAIVIPVFDEDVGAVSAVVAVMRRSLRRLGPTGDVHVHVLSDSRDPATAAAEETAVAELNAEPGPAVLYRRRGDNPGRKAGNIAEFLRRTEGEYDFMIVMDADSLMSGAVMRKLIRLMEENERVALIQTISFAANRMTLFARIQQFAVRLYAPLSLKGMSFWQGADGLYYGHNAIVRCAPFLRHAQLPVLPGRPPLGGEILCHDVVEAALLRRAGWEVRVLPDLEGTWEEMPTNVVDLLGRERRWCQGNLQHIRVLPFGGLTAGSRTHIAMGILSYLVGPIWWAFLGLGAVRAFGSDGTGLGILAYGATEAGPAAATLFWFSVAYLLGPRIMNVARAFLATPERRGFGGSGRLVASVLLEQVFSILLTPLLSLITVRFVLSTFAGRVVGWNSQSRADRDVGWAEAFRVLWLNLAVGAVFAAAALHAGGWYALWMLPTILGLLLGPFLIVWSSRLSTGMWARRWGLFLTVDESAPAPELVEFREVLVAGQAA